MKISIGIPFYNAEEFLADAIRSVFAQTYTNWELILIDDGSTDKSLEIAKSINDPRVSVYSDGKNKKLAARLNEIVDHAKYDLIARMDADDLMSPNRLEKQLEILKLHPEISLVSTGTFSITNNLQLIGVRGENVTSISFSDLLNRKASILHAAILGRKKWFKRNRYDPSVKRSQDLDLWLRSSKKKDLDIYLLEEPLYYYREEGSANSDRLLLSYKNERIMYKKYADSNLIFLLTQSYIRTVIVKGLSIFGLLKILLNRRSNTIIEPKVLNIFNEEVSTIKSIILPKKDNN